MAIVSTASVPESLSAPLCILTDQMGLDFCASDFKIFRLSISWVYLQTNAAPMFAAFGPSLADAIVGYLMTGGNCPKV